MSILASIIGGASKLAIRKSWLIEAEWPNVSTEHEAAQDGNDSDNNSSYRNADSDFIQTSGHSEGSNTSPDVPNGAPSNESSISANRESFSDELNDEVRSSTSPLKCWAYSLRGSGMIGMTFLNPACSVMAMNYASPSILAPFSGLTLVWIVLLSKPLVDEEPSRLQIGAASMIVLGETIIALFGDHTNEEGVTLEDIERSYLYPPFLLYLAGLTVWTMLLVYRMKYGSNVTLRRFSWGVSGGSITGLQNFLKDSLTILSLTEAGSYPWYLPIMILLAAGSAFGGLLFLTACMKRYDATYSAAMFVGSFVVSASIMSATHYGTFSHLTTIWNWIMYPFGLLVLIAGVWMLLFEQEQRSNTHLSTEAPPRITPVELVRTCVALPQ